MNIAFYIAKRYAISFSKNKAINIITGIAAIGIIASTMALFIFLSVFSGLKQFTLNFANVTDPDLKVETASGKFFTLSEQQLQQLKSSKNIQGFSKIIQERVYFLYHEKEIVATLKGVDTQFNKVNNFDKHLYAGNWLEENTDEVVIGADISRKLAIGLFDYNHSLAVFAPKPGKGSVQNTQDAFNKIHLMPVGIYSVNEEIDAKYVFCNPIIVQDLLGLAQNKYSNLELKLMPNADENAVRKELTTIFGTTVKIKNRVQLNASLYKMLQAENLFIYLFSTLVVILTLFCLAGAIVMIIIDKKENLKTLNNLGLLKTTIRTVFFLQGIIITFIGLIIGLILAVLIVLMQQHFLLIMITESMPYPVLFEWKNLVIVVATIFILGVISSWIASSSAKKGVF